ncbi:MAG: sugar ABC transporter ATP-binding protein [Abditibacteriota bacterium]|nr:sugar ABC transporter ATP-binding protein [Abditibacteriota bacterium]
MSSPDKILEIRDLTKIFGEVTVLDKVNFDLKEGEIHGLCGENGAGKSTLLKCISGVYPTYSGQILLNGSPCSFADISESRKAGLAVIYQELSLVNELSIAENIFLGEEPISSGLINTDVMYSETAKLLSRFNLDLKAEALVGDLGVGKQQLVEIAKALSKNARILLFDEPSSALTEAEVKVLMDIIRGLRENGVSCVYISHKLDEIFDICDRVTVLRDGKTIKTMDIGDTDTSEVISLMVGREITDIYPGRDSHPGETALEVEGLSVEDEQSGKQVLKDISFSLRKGEILGLGGLMGAGRTELVMNLFAAYGRRTAGKVKINGKEVRIQSPRDAISCGMVLLTEDRKRYGLILDNTISFNMSLSSLDKFSKSGFVNEDLEIVEEKKHFDELNVKAKGIEQYVGELSGGNQQKIVLGKALMADFDIIIFDEPTRGIDVGAKHEIYEIMNSLTAAGKAVVMISGELPELMGMSDRIIVLSEGEMGGEFGKDATQEELMTAAIKFSK